MTPKRRQVQQLRTTTDMNKSQFFSILNIVVGQKYCGTSKNSNLISALNSVKFTVKLFKLVIFAKIAVEVSKIYREVSIVWQMKYGR